MCKGTEREQRQAEKRRKIYCTVDMLRERRRRRRKVQGSFKNTSTEGF